MDTITTSITRLPKILLYAIQGMGKSTFGKEMERPVFIQTTDGLEGLGVQAFPIAKSMVDVRHYLNQVLTDKHDRKTLSIDTIGWMEKLIHIEVCEELNLQYMTQASMKSYPLAKQKLAEIMKLIDRINIERKMYILYIGHATIQKFEDPTTASYDRYELDMNEKCANMILQDVDIVGFMNTPVRIEKNQEGFKERSRAMGGGSRVIYFDPRPAFYAKQHDFDLPAELPVKKGEMWSAVHVFIAKKISDQQELKKGGLASIAEEHEKAKVERAKKKEILKEVEEVFKAEEKPIKLEIAQ